MKLPRETTEAYDSHHTTDLIHAFQREGGNSRFNKQTTFLNRYLFNSANHNSPTSSRISPASQINPES